MLPRRSRSIRFRSGFVKNKPTRTKYCCNNATTTMFMIINGIIIIIIIVRVLIVFENIVREPKHLANIVKSNLSHHAKTIGSQYYIVYVRIDCDEFFFFFNRHRSIEFDTNRRSSRYFLWGTAHKHDFTSSVGDTGKMLIWESIRATINKLGY